MEFPNVPFDENLFESNQMMKDYWSRTTAERSIDYVRDVIHEETALPEDGEAAMYQELRELSEQNYQPADTYVSQPSAPLADVFLSSEGAVVRPKSRAASATNSAIVAGVAVAILVLILFFSVRQKGEGPRVSPRAAGASPSRSRRV